jgi:hypothetical protein
MSIQALLQRHYAPTGLAGAKPRRAALIDDLQRHYRVNVRLHLFVLVLLVLALVAAAGFVAWHAPLENKDLAAVIAALGAFFGAAVELVRRVTREWSHARLLVSVVGSMNDEQATALVAKLLETPRG